MQNRLYVGNLTGDAAANSLQELFEPHGFVMDVKPAGGDKAGQRTGCAYVTRATDEVAAAATKALNGTRRHRAVSTVEVAKEDHPWGHAGSGGGS